MPSLTIEEYLQIVKHLADKCASVPECGYVVPAPIYFQDKADFLKQIVNIATNTQKAVETQGIAFTAITFGKFEDLDEDAGTDEPQAEFTYAFYIFRQYDLERADESSTPDDFLKRTLKSYNSFIAAILGLRSEFLGTNPLPDMDSERFAEVNTKSLAQDEFIFENEVCRYIPVIRGFACELSGTVEILIREC